MFVLYATARSSSYLIAFSAHIFSDRLIEFISSNYLSQCSSLYCDAHAYSIKHIYNNWRSYKLTCLSSNSSYLSSRIYKFSIHSTAKDRAYIWFVYNKSIFNKLAIRSQLVRKVYVYNINASYDTVILPSFYIEQSFENYRYTRQSRIESIYMARF